MNKNFDKKIGIVFPGDESTRKNITPKNNKLSQLFNEFYKNGIQTEPIVYSDEFANQIETQLENVDIALIWVNPLEHGRNRDILNSLLKKVSQKGVFISAHPDVIHKLGTKEVLYQTRFMEWSNDICLYQSFFAFKKNLIHNLLKSSSRVLKQLGGNGGDGVWRVEILKTDSDLISQPNSKNLSVRVIHALRNSREEKMTLNEFINRMEKYFMNGGRMIDQDYVSPIPNGMIRCYLCLDKVVGFGHQYVTALVWPKNNSPSILPQPRIYFSEDEVKFQNLRKKMELEWIPQLKKILDIHRDSLPILWDADFLHASQSENGIENYILCEINVCSVYPFPESALPHIISAVKNIKSY